MAHFSQLCTLELAFLGLPNKCKINKGRYKMQETKIDNTKTALLIIDMQNEFITPHVLKEESVVPTNKGLPELAKEKGIISNTAKVIAAARKVGMPIIFTKGVHRKDRADVFSTIRDDDSKQHRILIEGTLGFEVTDELKPAPEDFIICKYKSNAFYNTSLETILRSQGLDTVIISGVVTNGCVASTVRGAEERNFHVIVLSDCCAAATAEADEYFIRKAFPRVGRVRTSDEMVRAISRAGA